MKESRWKKIESIFHEALSLHGESREKYLAEACQDDDGLRSEVTSLLASSEKDDEFLEKGGLPPLTPVSEAGVPTFNTGVILGDYEIIKPLGAGAMGEVYLARDQHLGRKVALKILPAGFAGSIESLRREAQAASALNHPNILTIYAFGQQSDLNYIVTEFVDGVQLRQKIGTLSLTEALNCAHQIGKALEAAHSAGIIHRDIKPENIMVRHDGLIKVLDFGLVKVVRPQPESGASIYQRLAGSGVSTPGLMIGTLNYMSPEQVRGQLVDPRTDIWSWGVVLYEMLSNRRPFEAPTPQETLASILHKEPEAPSGRGKLNALVLKALSKRPEDRFQTMGEALGSLERVEIEIGGRASQWHLPGWSKSIRSGSSKRRRKTAIWSSAVLGVIVVGIMGAYLVSKNINRPAPPSTTAPGAVKPTSFKPTSLTKRGDVTHAALSPDGESVVYSEKGTGDEELRMYQLSSGEDTGMTKAPHGTRQAFKGITFSKDGSHIYYMRGENGKSNVYSLRIGDQDPKLILSEDNDSPISFSPDGKRFAFVRINRETSTASIIMENGDDAMETVLWEVKPSEPVYLWTLWSLDGRSILFASYYPSIKISSIDVENKKLLAEKSLGRFLFSGRPTWIKDGRSILAAAQYNYSDNSQLFEISWPEGVISPVSQDLQDYNDVDSLPDMKKMIAVQTNYRSEVWRGRADSGAAKPIPVTNARFSGIAWMPSGSIVSESEVSGQPELLAIDPDNGERKPVTHDIYNKKDPVVSPDGKYLVYASRSHLWVKSLIDPSAKPMRLTKGDNPEYQPSISSDSELIVYTSVSKGFEYLWKISIKGGEPTPITTVPSRKADISSDGKFVVAEYLPIEQDHWLTGIFRISDGALVKPLPGLDRQLDDSSATPVRWSTDGKHLIFIRTNHNVSNLWRWPRDGGSPSQLTHFKEEQIFAFVLSSDRQSFACLRGTKSSDVVLLEPANTK